MIRVTANAQNINHLGGHGQSGFGLELGEEGLER